MGAETGDKELDELIRKNEIEVSRIIGIDTIGENAFPLCYFDYADPHIIDPSWAATTMDVVRTLDRELNWRRLSDEEQKVHFAYFAETSLREIQRQTASPAFAKVRQCVYAVAYSIAWKMSRSFCALENDASSVAGTVSFVLDRVTKPDVIGKFDIEKDSPVGFLTAAIYGVLAEESAKKRKIDV